MKEKQFKRYFKPVKIESDIEPSPLMYKAALVLVYALLAVGIFGVIKQLIK